MPKGTLETLALDRLTFDARLQNRDYPAGALVDPEVVARYAEAMADGDEFPPLEAVYDRKRYWVIGGFNRGQAYKDRGVGSVRVTVYPGTFDQAELWSLSQNGKHGEPKRTQDIRKSFDRLFAKAKHLDAVLGRVKHDGGVHRTIAKAIGCTQSIVGKHLAERGLKATRDGRLAPLDPPKPTPVPVSPARASDQRPTPPTTTTEYVPTPEPELPGVPAGVRSAIAVRPRLDALMRAAGCLAKEFAALAAGPAGAFLRDVRLGGLPLAEQVTRKSRGKVATDWECPLLLGLARAIGAARVQTRQCAGCGGDGCKFCADHGFLPESLEYLTDVSALANEIVAKAAGRK